MEESGKAIQSEMEKEKDAQAKEEETKKKSPVQVNLFSGRTVLYPFMLCFKCVKDWACI
jgi:hypothetical protein